MITPDADPIFISQKNISFYVASYVDLYLNISQHMEITIRPLTNVHCPQILDLILPIQQIEFNVPVTREAQPDLLDIDTHYSAGGGGFWGAFDQHRLVGTIALISTGHRAGALRKMFVQKEYRGKESGIAQRLFLTLEEHCVKGRITDLYLGTVEILTASHRFYQRNGFQRIDKNALPDYFPRMAVDTIFYHLHLAKQQQHERD
jgi:N-acetylglutamate synthase-like GNAT family acetyltransferase